MSGHTSIARSTDEPAESAPFLLLLGPAAKRGGSLFRRRPEFAAAMLRAPTAM
jgi:hypothetical protein